MKLPKHLSSSQALAVSGSTRTAQVKRKKAQRQSENESIGIEFFLDDAYSMEEYVGICNGKLACR